MIVRVCFGNFFNKVVVDLCFRFVFYALSVTLFIGLHASGSFCCVGRWLYDCGASIGRLRKLGSLLRLWATIAGLFPKYAETNLFLESLIVAGS